MGNGRPTTQERGANATSAETLLDVRDLETKFFTPHGVVNAVNGVSFQVDRGELVGLVGETGCGKSVTVRAILGLVRPPGRITGGSCIFDGRDLPTLKRGELRSLRGSQIGFVPQNPWGALNPVLRIDRQMRNVLTAHSKTSHEECWEMSVAALKDVGIGGPERVLKGYAHQLSGGMAQRVVFSMALLLNPQLVIADEPTTGLDVTIQRQILELIHALLAREGRAMLLVTHDLGVVAQYCHRVVVMYAGRVVEVGPVVEVFSQPAHPYTKALLEAVPRPGESLRILRGDVPNLMQELTGCVFAPRCEFAHLVDSEQIPELRQLSPDRLVACHLPTGVSGIQRAG